MPRLRRTSPDQPGWTRRRAGRGFTYLDEHGRRLPEEDAQRVRELVIPPAWRDVWVTPYPHGHLQAVGTDDAGRRQYLYHPEWRTRRDAEKFERMLDFGKALARARELVRHRPGPRGHAAGARLRGGRAAAGPRLLPDRQRRVRRRERQLRADHAGAPPRAPPPGPAGLRLRRQVRGRARDRDRRPRGDRGDRGDAAPARGRPAAAVLQGRPLVALGAARPVNAYLRETTGLEATAKDFRTWHATVLAAAALAETPEPGETQASRKRAVAGAMKEVVVVPRQHPDAGPLGVRRPAGGRGLRGRPDDRVHHPAYLRQPRRAPGGPGARHAAADPEQG